MPKVLSIAHRGYSKIAPENTLAAFRRAIEQNPDYIECDIHRTKDGKIVVCHDPKVDRCTNGSGAIVEMTYDELRALDAGSWFGAEFAGEKLPSFDEYLDLFSPGGGPRPQIELKVEGLEEDVSAAILAHGLEKEAMVISFHYSVGLRLHEVNANLMFGALKSSRTELSDAEAAALVDDAVAVKADLFAFNYPYITPAMVSAAHAAGLKMAGWTIDAEDDMRKWAAMGVDCITSNDIVLLNNVLVDMGLR